MFAICPVAAFLQCELKKHRKMKKQVPDRRPTHDPPTTDRRPTDDRLTTDENLVSMHGEGKFSEVSSSRGHFANTAIIANLATTPDKILTNDRRQPTTDKEIWCPWTVNGNCLKSSLPRNN